MGRVGEALVKMLPAAVARLLLLAVVVGALALHFSAVARISALERATDQHEFKMQQLLTAMQELTSEVRNYREDIRQENKALKKQRLTGPKE